METKGVSGERLEFRFSREVRMGVVLYGGVSLADYIPGVAQEMFRAVRGDGLYGLLKLLTDSDVVVDVVSGTSAGGLNGIYLSYALTAPGTRNFLRFSNLWREQGDIGKLLREPARKGSRKQSLLDGEGYYQEKLAAAFGDLDRNPPLGSALASEVTELDCFITGTDVAGDVYTRFDDQGRPITVKDHRTVFQLKYRAGRGSDFQPRELYHQALAKLARITSCFPVAFPPVPVHPEAPASHPDSLLSRWGRLRHKGCSTQRVYLDGGVLDNKPFSHTLEAIFRRTANRPVKRVLFYVEPVPEVFREDQAVDPPSVVEAAIGATMEIPRYESISGDLETVLERNRRLDQMSRILEGAAPQRDGVLDLNALGKVSAMQLRVYERARALHMITRILEGIFRENGRNQLLEGGARERAAAMTRRFFDLWTDPDSPASGLLLSQLKPCDPYYRLRALFHVAYHLIEVPLVREEGGRYTPTAEGQTLHKVNRLIALHEILLFHMESLVDRIEAGWKSPGRDETAIWCIVQNCFHELLPETDELKNLLAIRDPFLPPEQLTRFHDALRTRLEAIVEKTKTEDGLRDLEREPNLNFSGLMDWIDRQLTDPVMRANHAASQAWEEFPLYDAIRFPLQLSAGFGELDRIRVVRISPKDAQTGFSERDASQKLAGAQFSNFGGFFKKSWRSNDVLWGRLDGVCKLAEELMDRERFRELSARPGFAALLTSRLDLYSTQILSHFDNEPQSRMDVEALLFWIRELVSNDPATRAAALARWDEMRALLIRAEQRDIVRELWPEVLQDSITEMLDWNRVSQKAKDDSPAPVFEVKSMRFDRQVTAQAAAAFAHFGLRHLLAHKSIDEIFQSHYRVGEERILQTLPPSVLAETGSRAMLVLRDCLLDAMDESRAESVRKTALFRFGIDLPARSMYTFARLGRYAPESTRVAIYALLSAGFTALLATAVAVVTTRQWFDWMTTVSIFGLGATILGFAVRRVVFWRTEREVKKRS
jgi:patatin-related protein